MASLEQVAAGDAVCYLGVGLGREAIAAAKLGARVTVVDVSRSMLDEFEAGLAVVSGDEGFEYEVDVLHTDVRQCEMLGVFDVVVANFFLNVFPADEVAEMVKTLVSLATPSGTVVVGDFLCNEDEGAVLRLAQKLNWYCALVTFRCITDNAWHSVYDYRELFRLRGWEVKRQKKIKVLGMPLYHSCVYRRERKKGKDS